MRSSNPQNKQTNTPWNRYQVAPMFRWGTETYIWKVTYWCWSVNSKCQHEIRNRSYFKVSILTCSLLSLVLCPSGRFASNTPKLRDFMVMYLKSETTLSSFGKQWSLFPFLPWSFWSCTLTGPPHNYILQLWFAEARVCVVLDLKSFIQEEEIVLASQESCG